jgi:hypothetical protein
MVEGFEKNEKDYDPAQKEIDEIMLLGMAGFGSSLPRPNYLDDILREKNKIPWDWN